MATAASGAGDGFEEWVREEFNPAETFSKPEALKGYRVLSCTQYILGPSCASYLGELGAGVIMLKLAAKSDVMVENYRPGTFDRWGVGYRQLREVNQRLVYAWLGGFGGWGPGRTRASYDILGQAQGGAFGITGVQEEFGGYPSKHTIWLADYWGGMMQAVHILAALHWRETQSGEGAFLEYSQVDGVTRQLEWSLPVYGRYGVVRQRWGNWDTELAVHGIIRCGRSSHPESDNPQEQEQ